MKGGPSAEAGARAPQSRTPRAGARRGRGGAGRRGPRAAEAGARAEAARAVDEAVLRRGGRGLRGGRRVRGRRRTARRRRRRHLPDRRLRRPSGGRDPSAAVAAPCRRARNGRPSRGAARPTGSTILNRIERLLRLSNKEQLRAAPRPRDTTAGVTPGGPTRPISNQTARPSGQSRRTSTADPGTGRRVGRPRCAQRRRPAPVRPTHSWWADHRARHVGRGHAPLHAMRSVTRRSRVPTGLLDQPHDVAGVALGLQFAGEVDIEDDHAVLAGQAPG